MAKTGKRLKSTLESIDRDRFYDLGEAVKMIKTNANTKFDETIDP